MLNRKVDTRHAVSVVGDDCILSKESNVSAVYAVLNKRKFEPWHVSVDGELKIQKDLALILCSYGHDERRIAANKKALEWTLASNPRPATIVFVEAFKEGEELHFDYLVGRGVKYFTRVIPKEGEGIWLKEALWSIGAREALKNKEINNLIFLDADCEFCRQDWAVSVTEALKRYEVITPYSFGYYSNQPDAKNLVKESTGFCATKNENNGFPGFALGFTKEFFVEKLDNQIWLSSNGGGDTLFWRLVRGAKHFYTHPAHYCLTEPMNRSISQNEKVGCANLLLCHIGHGPFSERGYNARAVITVAATEVPMTEYKFLGNGMPIWNTDLAGGRILAKVYPGYRKDAIELKEKADTAYARKLYDEAAEIEYGAIDADNPLVIACLLRTGGVYTAKHVLALKKQFEKHCKTPFRFVCFSDIAIEGVEVMPLQFAKKDCPGWWGQVEYFRKGLFGENDSVLTCDLDNVVLNDFTMHQCPKGQFFTGREFGKWVKSNWTIWNFGVTYWRGDFGCVFDAYKEDIKHHYKHPHYQHISVQEFVFDTLRSHAAYPRDVDAHIMTRFFNGVEKKYPVGTVILQFPGHPKPWEITPKPSWMPNLEV